MIIQIILIYLCFCSFSLLLCTCYNSKFEYGLPIFPLLSIVILYVFGLLNLLNIGFFILLLLVIACYIISIYRFIKNKNKKDLLSKIFNSSYIIFSIVFLFIVVLCKNYVVLYWDELRLWGAYPKILYYTNSMPQGLASPMFEAMKGYQPGMPLLQYFFLKLGTSFKDSILYIVYYSFCASFIIPAFKTIKKNNWFYIFVAIILTILLPYIFYNPLSTEEAVAYSDIFIDCALGVLFGFSICYMFFRKIKKLDIFIYSLSLCVLTLFKTTGLIFALASFGLFTIDYLFFKNKFTFKTLLKNLKVLFLPFISIIFGFLSWKIFLSINSVNLVTKLNDFSILKNLMNFPSYYILTIKQLFNKLFIIPSVSGFIPLFFFIIFFAIVIVLTNIKRKDKKRNIVYSLFIIIFLILYLLSLLYTYLFGFKEWEAISLASFRRYSNTYLIAIGIFLIYYLFNYYKDKNYKLDVRSQILSIILIIFFIGTFTCLPFSNFKNLIKTKGNNSNTNNTSYNVCHQLTNKYLNDIENSLENNNYDKIYFMIDETQFENLACEKTLVHHYLYYDALDKGYFISNFETLSINIKLGNENENDKTFKYWKNILDDTKYLYIANPITNEFKNKFDTIFNTSGDEIESNILYKIGFTENSLVLKKV